MLEAIVFWIAVALIPEPAAAYFPSKAECEQAVQSARNRGIAVTDCAKVDLGKPYAAKI